MGCADGGWVIQAAELFGETEHSDVWEQLARVIQKPLCGMQIQKALIDSGYKPGGRSASHHAVYQFCRKFKPLTVPTKGRQSLGKPIQLSNIDMRVDGKVLKKGVQLAHLDSDYFKSLVHNRVNWPDGEPGSWHLPSDITEEFCHHIVAEQRVMLPSGQASWIEVSKDNHYLDAVAGAAAAAYLLGAHNFVSADDPNRPQLRQRRERSKGRSIYDD